MSLSLRPSCNLCSLKLRYSHFDLIFFFASSILGWEIIMWMEFRQLLGAWRCNFAERNWLIRSERGNALV